jgi:hypothetical protein
MLSPGSSKTPTDTLDGFVRQAVSEKVSLIVSDEHAAYRNLSDKFEHAFVRHSVSRYVDGVVLPLYVAEFEFRYNNRNNPDIFSDAIARC